MVSVIWNLDELLHGIGCMECSVVKVAVYFAESGLYEIVRLVDF